MSVETSPNPFTRPAVLVAAILSVGMCAGVVLYRRGAPAHPAPPTASEATAAEALPSAAFVRGRDTWTHPIQPIPDLDDGDPARAALGRRLFHDPLLSRDGTISCASCHDIATGGADGRVQSIGVDGALGGINAPTVLNARFNFRQFWNGRARDLEAQVEGPLLHAAEMDTTWEAVLAKLTADAVYTRDFQAAYGRPVDEAAVRDAIATFERSLITPGSPFDRWLAGEEGAISDEAKAGYELFVNLGCTTCHQGVNVGGNMFQPFGQGSRYFDERGGELSQADLGRFAVTGEERDRHVFRVAPLRNVELTAPYLHDGSAATLQEAVQVMARHQLGEELDAQEVDRIVAFLVTLTGDLDRLTQGHAR